MRAFTHTGQRSVEELVDRYPVRDAAIRQLLIDYVHPRKADSDYCHVENMTRMLVGQFWSAIEAINPVQPSTLRIDRTTYEQRREGLNWLPDGTARKDRAAPLTVGSGTARRQGIGKAQRACWLGVQPRRRGLESVSVAWWTAARPVLT
ncbi:hypothetical protein AB0H00_22320 [Nocardia sp. NPDC023852]|uniref:hypothetical protein n=1 Tax=Nocardia sp. NPDC023852 TaxID=3154697 RepID=UPI0033D60E37